MLAQLKKYLAFIVIAAMLGLVLFGWLKWHGYQKELADLRNQVAAKDKTTEELKDTYTKLDMENNSLKSSNASLQSLLNKTGQDLISEQQATVYWKGQYTVILKHEKETADAGVPPDFKPPETQVACTPAPQEYVASTDIGILKFDVHTFTVDPSYQQNLVISAGTKPLVLTVDLTRDQNMQWHSHVVSSDSRIGVDLGINSVNISQLEEKWYEKIRLSADFGGGLGGILAGVGASYQFGNFDVGPHVWGVAGTNSGVFFGASVGWNPFKKSN
jgi:cell division protein FtsB